MNERILIQVVGSVMVYDATARQWNPAGTSSGLSSVRLIHCLSNNTFRIHGQKINDAREVVLDNQITRGVKYNRTNDAFIQWHDSQAFWGLNFRRGTQDAENFFNSVVSIIETLNQGPAQQPQQPQQLQQQSQQQQQKLPNELASNNQQQQLQQQSSAAVIQRSIQQHQLITQPPTQLQQPQQQQAPQQQQMLQHMLNQQHQQHQSQAMLGPAPPIQMMQQQSQQMMHQRQPQTQSLANQNQIQHYQHPHQAHMQQQHQQPPQIQQPQVAQVVSAPIPPPPPPPPPAAIAGALNNCRTNGTSSSSGSTNTESQRSSIITNSSNLVEANGGSPSQMSMLASELARCQLRKVSLARSDSDTPRDSESNNNNVGVPKTIRAASFASAESNLMNDLAKRLASTREQLEKGTENHSSNNHGSSNNLNGTGIDKSHESWLADLISKEISKGISKEMARFKVELLDVIKEFKQR